MPFKKAFFAFPSGPGDLRETIDGAVQLLPTDSYDTKLTTWPLLDIFGSHISDQIREEVAEADVLVCDITVPNLNVYYEIGYAIGQGKAIAPVLNVSFAGATNDVQNDGLFDVIGYKTYENREQLREIFEDLPNTILLDLYARDLNPSQPVYFLSAFRKTDFINHIASFIKASKVHFRSFDPAEIARFSTVHVIADITASSGIVIPFLGSHIEDARRHNLRAAFLAGLAHGLERETLILQHQTTSMPAPTDYRDLVQSIKDPEDIGRLIADFAKRALEATQFTRKRGSRQNISALQKLTLGAIAAENEFRELSSYFVETSEFLRTVRGEVRIVAGRKGSGKTAIFFMARDTFRRQKNTIVIDLKPESHQLTLFREKLLELLDAGAFDHTVAAFWNFVVLSEILLALLRDLQFRAQRNPALLSEVLEIEQEVHELDVSVSGDFTTRLNRLSDLVLQEVERLRAKGKLPSANALTNIIFQRGVGPAKRLILKHTRAGSLIVMVFDNIDKGWATKGVEASDVRIVRLLLEALEKVKRDLDGDNRQFISTLFLRNDVYELLVDETPDRGKAAVVRIDWTDRAKLRQVIFQRLVTTTHRKDQFSTLWGLYFRAKVGNIDSFEYLVDHCMMRPRFLINIIELAIANAINRGHSQVESDDCTDAVHQHALYLLDEFGYEIRDVSGLPNRIIHSLVGTTEFVTKEEIQEKFVTARDPILEIDRAFDLLLWYGVLGIVAQSGNAKYIYDFDYSMNRLQAEIDLQGADALYVTNPALRVALRAR